MKIGETIQSFKSCSSTNDVAKEMALQGAEDGTVFISEEQTKGRGTKGRSWFSARKKGLYLSIILRPKNKNISLLPLMAGIAIREAIFSSTGLGVSLLWPNDLIWKKKKLGGILCESEFLGNHLNYVILGIGLNLAHSGKDFPEEIRHQSTSLKLATKRGINVNRFLANLWEALNNWYLLFCHDRKDDVLRSFLEYSVFPTGKTITVIQDEIEISGIFVGLDSHGGLILESKGKKISFYSSEIKSLKYK